MLLHFQNGQPFAVGVSPYTYRAATDLEGHPRVILTVLIEDRLETQAMVDTGGVHVLLTAEIASELRFNPKDGISTPNLLWRGLLLKGVLHRISVTLLAEEGNGLIIDATAFVPELSPNQEWLENFPCILGMSGCLERLRFAIDPLEDKFYFGDLTGESLFE